MRPGGVHSAGPLFLPAPFFDPAPGFTYLRPESAPGPFTSQVCMDPSGQLPQSPDPLAPADDQLPKEKNHSLSPFIE